MEQFGARTTRSLRIRHGRTRLRKFSHSSNHKISSPALRADCAHGKETAQWQKHVLDSTFIVTGSAFSSGNRSLSQEFRVISRFVGGIPSRSLSRSSVRVGKVNLRRKRL